VSKFVKFNVVRFSLCFYMSSPCKLVVWTPRYRVTFLGGIMLLLRAMDRRGGKDLDVGRKLCALICSDLF